MPLQHGVTFDKSLQLADTIGTAITSSAAGLVAAAAAIIDVGAARIDGCAVVDYNSMDATTGDEKYQAEVQGSVSPSFATVDALLGVCIFGGATAQNLAAADPAAGRREIPFCNEVNGTVYRYVRIFWRLSGTTPSVKPGAFLAKVMAT